MVPIRRILLPTDFSLCAETAYRHALHLAGRYQAEVHLLHVAPEAAPHQAPGGVQDLSWPDRLAGPAGASPAGPEVARPVLHRTVVPHESPVQAILEYAHAHAVDLIVMGTHGDRGAGHFLSIGSAFLGHTAEQIVRHAPCPVLRVMMRNGGRDPAHVQAILVMMDASSLAQQGLAYARELAHLYGARVELLRVLERGGGDPPKQQEAEARQALQTLFEAMPGPAVPAGYHVATGRPYREALAFVKQQSIDLIVQGAHSDGGREALGSVAEQIVRLVPVTVLTVRPVQADPKKPVGVHGSFYVPCFFL